MGRKAYLDGVELMGVVLLVLGKTAVPVASTQP